jgi:hypothetical protein
VSKNKSLGYLTVSQTPQLKILIMKESLKQLFAHIAPTIALWNKSNKKNRLSKLFPEKERIFV